MHLSSRSFRVAAPRGVRDRPRCGPGRHPQPGAAAASRPVGELARRSVPASGLVLGRRSSGRRRTIVSAVELRRRGDDRFRCGIDDAGSRSEHTFAEIGRASGGDSDDRDPFVIRAVHWYQRAVEGRPSPCRFTPTCSSYAVEALEVHGTRRGLWLTVRRLIRCRPFGPSGWDPVPEHSAASDAAPPSAAPRLSRKRIRA